MGNKTNCTINGKDYYRIRKTIGYKVVNGKKKPIQKPFYGENKSQAEKAIKEWERQQARSESVKAPDTPFGALASFYVDNVLNKNSKYADTTKVIYTSAYHNFVEPDIELMSHVMCDIKGSDIQLFFNRLNTSYSNTIAVNKFMSGLFRWLDMEDYCKNYMNYVVMPVSKGEKKEIEVWDDYSIQALIDLSENYRLRLLMVMALGTGLRNGELRGLKYDDIHDGSVYVNRQIQRRKVVPPKDDSYRSIPLHPFVLSEIDKHRIWHEQEMKRKGYKTDYIFTTSTGKILDPSDMRRSLDRFYDDIAETHPDFIRHKLHAFRATFCTNLRKANVRIEIAAQLMGHKSIQVTMEYYSAVRDPEKISAVNLLQIG